MGNMKDALMRIINVAIEAKNIDEELSKHGYPDSPYAKFFGELAEGLYILVGEHSETFEESSTYAVMTAPFMDSERRAACLTHLYEINNQQPKPVIFDRQEMVVMHDKCGGYMCPDRGIGRDA